MRWTLRIGFLALVGWAVFMASPFVALYQLAQAVEARDTAAISERVNFHALRLSLSKQIVSEYLRTMGRGQELDTFERNLATSAGTTLADPLVARLVTPEAVVSLLSGRLPPEASAGRSSRLSVRPLEVGSVGSAVRIFMASQSRGFRNILIALPDGRPRTEQVRLHLRLSGTAWRLLGVELPQAMVTALVKQLPRVSA
jgi:hypothetical protein